jgi:hypothetical protein
MMFSVLNAVHFVKMLFNGLMRALAEEKGTIFARSPIDFGSVYM